MFALIAIALIATVSAVIATVVVRKVKAENARVARINRARVEDHFNALKFDNARATVRGGFIGGGAVRSGASMRY